MLMRINPPDESPVDWEGLGSTDPYWTVLTHEKFHASRLDDAARGEFFQSGEEHLDWVMQTVHEKLSAAFEPTRALDFGCGVGRVLIPLARRTPAVGVDVASSMLAEARKNLDQRGLNADLVIGDDALSQVTGEFDFIHSYIVLQHIPPARGERIVKALLERLEPGGIAVLHVTYALGFSTRQRLFRSARLRAPFIGRVWNVLKRRAASTPYFEVYEYDVRSVLDLLLGAGCAELYATLTDHGGVRGVCLFTRKGGNA